MDRVVRRESCQLAGPYLGLPYLHCAKGGQVEKVTTSADVQFSTQNQVKSKKSSAGRSLLSPDLKLPKIFVFLQQMIINHVFTVQNAEKQDVWAFFNVLGGQIIFN